MIDFTSGTVDFNIISPEISLLVVGFVILLISSMKNSSRNSFMLALFGLLLSGYFVVFNQWGHQQSGFFGMITCDNFGMSFKLIFLMVSFITVLLAVRFMNAKGINRPEFYALLLFSTMGMMVMANTTDLIVIFLGLEIMSVPLYVMAGFARRSLESNEAGIKYFFMGAFASGFLLLGIAFIFGASGTTDLRQIVTDYSFIISHSEKYLISGIALLLIGFGFKVGIVPFHSWIPDVYQGAPTPVTAFFSVGPKAAGFAALLRIFSFGFNELPVLITIFWVLAVLTMTVGNVLALRQDNVKRLLAYSSIAHAGYILVAITVGDPISVASAIFYLFAYAMFNFGGFAIVILLETRSGCKSNIGELAGMAKAHPYLAAVLALFMFALAGFPPTIGFIGKFYIFSAAVKSGFIWLTVIGVMNSFVSVYYYLRIVKAAYFDSSDKPFVPVSLTSTITLVLILTIFGTLGLGFFPQRILEFSQAALSIFL